ncbi:MAG: hypothetical protein AAGA31_16530, partial [Bacteroidota bacterium]
VRLYIKAEEAPLLVLSTIFAVWLIPRWIFFGVLAKLLVLRETNNQWFTTFLLFICWPAGIWSLQPRIDNAIKRPLHRNLTEHLL